MHIKLHFLLTFTQAYLVWKNLTEKFTYQPKPINSNDIVSKVREVSK